MSSPNARQVRIEFDQRVPMRDGVTLSADVYKPLSRSGESGESGRFPVILTRTPYLKLSEGMLLVANYFAERGYVFVAMDVRGRGDSEGVFIPHRSEERRVGKECRSRWSLY